MNGHRSIPVATCLLATLLASASLGRMDEGPQTFAGLKQEHELKAEALNQRREQAKTDADRDVLQAEIWEEIKSAANRAFAWAEAHQDDPESIDAIVWTIHGLANGYYAEYAAEIRRAYELLTERAIANEKVAPVCYYSDVVAVACPQARRFLEAALERSPSKLVRGAACLGLARDEHATARLARRLRDPITSLDSHG
jgi:hypothetical protein